MPKIIYVSVELEDKNVFFHTVNILFWGGSIKNNTKYSSDTLSKEKRRIMIQSSWTIYSYSIVWLQLRYTYNLPNIT